MEIRRPPGPVEIGKMTTRGSRSTDTLQQSTRSKRGIMSFSRGGGKIAGRCYISGKHRTSSTTHAQLTCLRIVRKETSSPRFSTDCRLLPPANWTGCSRSPKNECARGKVQEKKPLAGKVAGGLIFMKSSTRTRVSFEVGSLAARRTRTLFSRPATCSSDAASRSQTPARVLSRYVDGNHDKNVRACGNRKSSRATPTCRSSMGSPTSSIPVRCWRMSSRSGQHLGGYNGKARWPGSATANNMANSWLKRRVRARFSSSRSRVPEGDTIPIR